MQTDDVSQRRRKETYFIKFIFTLANNFLRWTYLGSTRFIHSWTALFHATLHVSDVIYKCNWWFVNVTFDWFRVMVAAVERNNQTRRIKTFLRRLFARVKSIVHVIWTKTKCKYKRWISFFLDSSNYERNRSRAQLTWRPSGVTYFARDPLRSYFYEPQENEIYLLIQLKTK